jgi:hypothetical protein
LLASSAGCLDLIDRLRGGGGQHGAVAAEVSDARRHRANHERSQRSDRHVAAADAEIEGVEPEAEHTQQRDEHNHDQPRLPTVRSLLLVKVHLLTRQIDGGYFPFLRVRDLEQLRGLEPEVPARMLVGNTCCAVLKFVAMSL